MGSEEDAPDWWSFLLVVLVLLASCAVRMAWWVGPKRPHTERAALD
jgi:hypothetical protein